MNQKTFYILFQLIISTIHYSLCVKNIDFTTNCSQSGTLSSNEMEIEKEILFEGCPNSFIQFHLFPEIQNANYELLIQEGRPKKPLYTFNNDIFTQSVTFASFKSFVSLYFLRNDSVPFSLFYSGIPRVFGETLEYFFGNGSLALDSLPANYFQKLRFVNCLSIPQRFEIGTKVEFKIRISSKGFAFWNEGPSRRVLNLLPENGVTEIEIRNLRRKMSESFYISWALEENKTISTELVATTTYRPPILDGKIFTIYFLRIHERHFYETQFPKFLSIVNESLPSSCNVFINPENGFRECRRLCGMSQEGDSGCGSLQLAIRFPCPSYSSEDLKQFLADSLESLESTLETFIFLDSCYPNNEVKLFFVTFGVPVLILLGITGLFFGIKFSLREIDYTKMKKIVNDSEFTAVKSSGSKGINNKAFFLDETIL